MLTIEQAREIGEKRSLDLLLVTENATPPVCKLINYGQFKYQQQKKEKQARKSTRSQVTKEIKMSPKISDHDYQVRINKSREFLTKGFKVKLSILFRGREIVHMNLGEALAKRFMTDLGDLGVADTNLMRSKRSLISIINPK